MARIVVTARSKPTSATATLGEQAYARTCGTCFARAGESCKNIASGLPMIGVHAMRMEPIRRGDE